MRRYWPSPVGSPIARPDRTLLAVELASLCYILELRANPFSRKRDLFQVVFKDDGFRDE